MFELMKSAQQDAKKGEPVYELHDVKVGELDALEVVTHLASLAEAAADANNAGAEQVQSIFGKMFGDDGTLRMYVAKADDATPSSPPTARSNWSAASSTCDPAPRDSKPTPTC